MIKRWGMSLSILVLTLSSPWTLASQQPTTNQGQVEAYLRGLMQEYRLPSLAVQVVDRDGPIWQITLGYRDTTNKFPVTGKTLFAIGSTTKAFTGLLLLQMQEYGDLKLDDPVQKYLPSFRVSDTRYSSVLTLRDLMTHSTGVGRHDLAWYHRPATRDELFSLIPFLEMAAPPRSQFIYNNWMWMTAGMVAEKLSGQTWEALIRDRIFLPLQMNSSALSVAEVKRSGDYALPYEVGPLGVNEVPFYDLGPMNPTGGIYSNLDDLAQWLRLHLNEGQLNSRYVLSKSSLEESYKRVQSMGAGAGYGLGWISLDLYGQRFLSHDGGIDGFSANISMMPDQGLGVVVLMNASSISPESIALRVWQKILNKKVTDSVRSLAAERERAAQEAMKSYPDAPAIPLSVGRAEFLGGYCHPAYPRVQVSESALGEDLMIQLPSLRFQAYAIAADAFSIRGQYDANKVIRFERDPEGRISHFLWGIEPTLAQPLKFSRCP